jgi:hypothetical protein
MDAAEQLQRLYVAGFDLQTFERFPNSVGVVRGDCVALFRVTPSGLEMVGTPGWRMGEVMGVLTTISGRRVFEYKQETLDATPERLAALDRFREDLTTILSSHA